MEMSYREASSFVQGRYPHLGKKENGIWTRFLNRTDHTFSRIRYDVHVGQGAEVAGQYSGKMKGMVESLTRKRIDCVGYAETGVYVFEVKPMANSYSIGQLDTYIYWFSKQEEPSRAVYGAVVCESVDRDAVPVFNRKGYSIYNVTEM